MSAGPDTEMLLWALDVLRRYAPDPVVDRDDELVGLDTEIDEIERLDAEQFFEDQQAPRGDRR